MAATQVKVKQETLDSEDTEGEQQAKQLAAAQTAAALTGVLPVGLTPQQMQQVLAGSAALGNLGQLGNLQYLSGVLAANSAAAAAATQEAVGQQSNTTPTSSSTTTTSPLLVVPQFPAQYMTYLPQLAAAQAQATNLSTESPQPQAAAPVTPSTGGYDSGVLDLSKGPNCKTSSPNSPDSGNNNLANIPYDARERTKTEKTGDAGDMKEDPESGKKGTWPLFFNAFIQWKSVAGFVIV